MRTRHKTALATVAFYSAGIALAVAIPFMTGCASYWQKERDSLPVVVQYADASEVAKRCGRPDALMLGCAMRLRTFCLVTVTRGDDCALQHERMHCEGYTHDPAWIQARLDCGAPS